MSSIVAEFAAGTLEMILEIFFNFSVEDDARPITNPSQGLPLNGTSTRIPT
jgi:hypothetical protein